MNNRTSLRLKILLQVNLKIPKIQLKSRISYNNQKAFNKIHHQLINHRKKHFRIILQVKKMN